MKTTSQLLAFAILCTWANFADAFGYHKCFGNKVTWPSNSKTLRVHSGSFPSGGARRDALEEAIAAWNKNPSNFQFSLDYGDARVGRNNGQSEIWFTADEDILDDSDGELRSGICFYWTDCANLVEADVVLADWDEYWTTSHNPTLNRAYGGERYPMQTTFLHELGHAMGLKHENDEYNIMGQDNNHLNVSDNTAHYYPGEDACDGAVFLYGLDANHRQDVSVTHWRYRGEDGEYSTHGRTKIYKSDGTVADLKTHSESDPIYKVTRGHTVRVQFTYENSGATSQSPLVRYYVSDDNNWDSGDTYLASTTPTIDRNKVFTPDFADCTEVTIPSSLTSGDSYYLLAVTDPNSAITEVNEDNNVSYIKIQIK